MGTMLQACLLLFPAQDLDKASKDFRDAVQRENAKETQETARILVSFNTAKAASALLGPLDAISRQEIRNATLYWSVIKAAASFSNAEALEEVAAFVLKHQSTAAARDILFMMQNNYAHDTVVFYARIVEKASDELKLMAIDQLGALQHHEGAGLLIEALKKNKNAEVGRRIAAALSAITGQDYADNVTNWEGWWNANKDKAGQGARQSDFAGGNLMTGLDAPRRNIIERTKKVPPEAILVIKAGEHDPEETKRHGRENEHNFDHIEYLLQKLGIPHTVINKEELDKNSVVLDGRLMVLVNCMMWRKHCVCEFCTPSTDAAMRLKVCKCSKTPPIHKSITYEFSDTAVAKIRRYVDGGGYLFTEDWALEELLTRKDAWPDLLKVGEYLKDQTARVFPKIGSTSSPYLKRIFAKPPKLLEKGTSAELGFEEVRHEWVIDKDSPKVGIVDPRRVTTLLVGQGLGVDDSLAVTFGSGDGGEVIIGTGKAWDPLKARGGRVLHVVSHFGKQKSESDEYTLQNLLVNFLIEGTERYAAKPQKKPSGQSRN